MMYYSVFKMAGYQGYTTRTHDIPVDVFFGMITNDIKNLIHIYGHKTCGLRHEELCEKIKNIIFQKKKVILPLMDKSGQEKLISDWESQRNAFINQLFEKEGFINMCYPPKAKGNPNLQKLKLKHIEFCKEKDSRRSALGKNPEYSECVEYNSWIEREKASFITEFLQNVHDYKFPNVKKYFSTKEHPQGHDPRSTYFNSKLNCNLYIPSSKKHKQKPVAIASPDSPHLPTSPDVGQESQGKDGKSMPDKDGTPNGQNTGLKAKGTDLPINAQDATKQPAEVTEAKAPSSQQLPKSQPPISPKDSSSDTDPNPPSSVIKDQDTDPDATPRTTSATNDTTHSIKNVQSSLASDLSLVQAQPQLPPVGPDTANNSKGPTPDPVIKSPALDSPPTTALGSGLASAPEAASNSSASGISSTIGSKTTDSTAASPPAQYPLLVTIPLQSTATAPIVTTPIHIQTTIAESGPSTTTVSAVGTQSIASISGNTSTIEEGKKEKAPLKTKSDTQDSISVSPNEHNDSTPPSIGAKPPGSSANLNINPSSGQTLRTPPGPLGPLPGSPANPPPGLSFGIAPAISPAGSVDVSPAVHGVVNHPGKYLNYNLFTQSDL
ncbi:hypothetical protein POVWA1_081680 [Plasmodium ovale wallikeri]|uniref:STP1 protein n=1 Tax=Plasmodium ovale wallikeri TaxID=864142 RepID=A0A1A9AMN9_PLAOA|nr:hypothetical protein POVWA1_081680 [Plasmodium ovale wallikeri]